MPMLQFEADTHAELVSQVRRWLETSDIADEGQMSTATAIAQGANLTKDALRIIAAAAPAPVAQNDVVKGLTNLGYKATDSTRDAMVSGLDALEDVTGGSVVRQVQKAGRRAAWEMNSTIAKQVLNTLKGS